MIIFYKMNYAIIKNKSASEVMECHPLNLAHQQHRRADSHLISNRYDDAIQCHQNAAELLLDAMKSTSSSIALESISLQHSYHLKQKDLIKFKKEQYARVKKAIDQIKKLSNDQSFNIQPHEVTQLPFAIYRAINKSENLLHQLTTDCVDGKDNITLDNLNGIKPENSQNTAIEELQAVNQSLHAMVEQLVLHNEILKDDKIAIKDRVNYLEKERIKYLNLTSNDQGLKLNTSNLTLEDSPIESPPLPLCKAINQMQECIVQQPHFDLSALRDN